MNNKKAYNRPTTVVEALTISSFMKDALSYNIDGSGHKGIIDENPPSIDAKPSHFNIWEESDEDDKF